MYRAVWSHRLVRHNTFNATERLAVTWCARNYSTVDSKPPPFIKDRTLLKNQYDAIIVGAGFKFSRASYVLSLLRPQIFKDLELKRHGLKVYLRDPYSYTPLLRSSWSNQDARSLLLSSDKEANSREIGKFSQQDAKNFGPYEEWLNRVVAALNPLLDTRPVDLEVWAKGSSRDKLRDLPAAIQLVNSVRSLGADARSCIELLTAPAEKVLASWFSSEPLQATLATDSTIGAMISPKQPGSGYVLLHHVMGGLEGVKGAWGYVEGGMGAVSNAVAKAAVGYGASVFTDVEVKNVMVDRKKNVAGVALRDGSEVKAKVVLSNATPKVTFLDLLDKDLLPSEFLTQIKGIDYTSPVTKINVAVNRLPNFTADPNPSENQQGPQHSGTIHLNCEHSDLIHQAYVDCQLGRPSKTPMMELTIPSTLDPTLAPPGCHVVQLFTQYTPFYLEGGREWTEQDRENYANTVFDGVEEYAPGFKASIIGKDVLTPCDLERVFGLTGGNIFHGAMSLDQLYVGRPRHRTPLSGLYLCGSGAHPGGGVMGSAGKLAAEAVLKDYK